jgi:hypothetical protein
MYLYCDVISVLIGEHYKCYDIQKRVLACYMAYNIYRKRLVLSC